MVEPKWFLQNIGTKVMVTGYYESYSFYGLQQKEYFSTRKKANEFIEEQKGKKVYLN